MADNEQTTKVDIDWDTGYIYGPYVLIYFSGPYVPWYTRILRWIKRLLRIKDKSLMNRYAAKPVDKTLYKKVPIHHG